MCIFPTIPNDNSGKLAQRLEDRRAALVDRGQERIDKRFDKFDNKFYGNYREDYLDNYNPQLDTQFGDASKVLKYDLARSGVLDSSTGINAFGKLTDEYAKNKQQIASDALGAVNQLKNSVSTAKTSLMNTNLAAADPGNAASTAASTASALGVPQTYSPLGQVFAGFVNGYDAYRRGQDNALPEGPRYDPIRPGFNGSGNGSGSVVNS